ncbi:MAG: hypothetical protein OXH50_12960 [Gemmatimonadetes bacterium]|nr:hypothetical protein [Gemmatimonadota bacterium]
MVTEAYDPLDYMHRSHWDVLHPGRQWAESLTAEENAEKIIGSISYGLGFHSSRQKAP